jgi:DNA processing protein
MVNYHALLAHFPKITYTRFKKLFTYFSNAEAIWHAEFNELVQSGIDESIADEFMHWKEMVNTDEILNKMEKERITTVSIGQPEYPLLLSEINDPPHTLFIRGTLPPQKNPTIAIVGTRHNTAYGKHICEEFSTGLAVKGITVVSGLALGIDGISHNAVVKAHGTTLAILGSGIDQAHIYPSLHTQLAEEIIETGGALISEYPPGFSATRYSFPARNRIIAGLSLGVLVIEAQEESGALITAHQALDYNREVMAIPHSLTSPTGKGNHKLLKQGASLVTTVEDVIELLNIKDTQNTLTNRATLPTTPTEERILSVLSLEPKHIDHITKESDLANSLVSSTLVLLEMKGRVKNIGAMMYVRK